MVPLICKSRVLSMRILATFMIIMVIYQLFTSKQLNECHSLHYKSAPSSESPPSQKPEEIQKLLEWPEPPKSASFMSSTSPKTTECSLMDPRTEYHVGDLIKVFIRARDHQSRPKTYGGDYFQAKLHSPYLKAGVSGSITDHRNGSYTATFLLPWPGICQIFISLVHSSEAIAIFKEKRDAHTYLVRVMYSSTDFSSITGKRPELSVISVPPDRTCVLTATRTPRRNGSVSVQRAFPAVRTSNTLLVPVMLTTPLCRKSFYRDDRGTCRPGLSNPDPSGYYYQDKWHSRVCRSQDFPTPAKVTSCLKGKVVYMFGDSTLRQWWEYLVKFVPSLQMLDLHVSYAPGPLLATDAQHGYLVQWRAHDRPLCMNRTRVQELRYIANELDNIGGENVGSVVVINCAAHFVFFPVNYYLKRIVGIRDAVARLLVRSPQTKVIIKSAHTGFLPPIGSDWLTWQLDTLMREVFSGLPVTILDTWQMNSCHYLPNTIHPKMVIVQNMVDLMLSFICPM
ncbi:PREDICTED: NXPE family member 3-like [Nanorana parkeri]|uniref:NXPE family member 3-like n=1 Tax=Nanorana parkeri TaxID=125878 RepID=UPI000854B34D|nr:PREDICTED: NXPE family member 3-like [Nanorana parkeri]